MNLIKPQKLRKGDTIAIIAPCGNVDEEKIKKAITYFKAQGFNVKTGSNIYNSERYLAGTDKERIEDLHNAFADKEVDAIICARGGYGAIRLLDKIDYSIIKENPKIFCGYSDVTALSAMILKKTGLITFSAPMAQSDFSAADVNKFTEEKFWQALTMNNMTISADNLKTYNTGETCGILFGGNLATIASLCGTDFIPNQDFIFFCEDLNEPAYKIDRYFRQLLNVSDFKKYLKAIIIGDFLDIDNAKWLDDLFYELAQELNIPIISGYPISHSSRKISIPIGAEATLKNGILTASY